MGMQLPDKEQLSNVRKYPLEIIAVCLIGAVIYLFIEMRGIDKRFVNYVIEQADKSITVIRENSEAVKENTEVIKNLKNQQNDFRTK